MRTLLACSCVFCGSLFAAHHNSKRGPCPCLLLATTRYHEESLKQMKFFDDNTRSWWTPITGGANVPALNDLLAPHGITLGERILQGSATVGTHNLQVCSCYQGPSRL